MTDWAYRLQSHLYQKSLNEETAQEIVKSPRARATALLYCSLHRSKGGKKRRVSAEAWTLKVWAVVSHVLSTFKWWMILSSEFCFCFLVVWVSFLQTCSLQGHLVQKVRETVLRKVHSQSVNIWMINVMTLWLIELQMIDDFYL